MTPHLRPGRTVIAALLGGITGDLFAYIFSSVMVPLLSGLGETVTETLSTVSASGAGILVGAAAALAFAFRREPVRLRMATVLVLLPAAPAFLMPALVLVASPVLALVGRLIALHSTRDRAAT